MTGRRRINGPSGLTFSPVYLEDEVASSRKQSRTRPATTTRNLFLKTGVAPASSGSAYLEIENPVGSFNVSTSGMKLVCTVHGPRALPKSAPFSPHLVLSTHVKYAPFATRQRRGYLRDFSEQDLSAHLELALRGVIVGERWPKSNLDVTVTVLEGDHEQEMSRIQGHGDWHMMNVLSGCITVASAAIADAGVDCVDMVAGGVSALVAGSNGQSPSVMLDPVGLETESLLGGCCIAYMPNRDEITNLWVRGQSLSSDVLLQTKLVHGAIQASKASHCVIVGELVSSAGITENIRTCSGRPKNVEQAVRYGYVTGTDFTEGL
ncbi:exoribonuclease [Sodiomyces alkalinus F11]|uniref:Exoribonuclease n=1 Tax=Sodiomyces alkalinus (strain CBS 110278 / VKM F-3762 / F11) TaxID=1314773 RepID=A0A3N2PJW3_SODAK|nr:exoribonuclease [Sodiomyces alkalinus F11]ROT34817.1 exoribonuclease [Sodiomyces alkalinus F11]